MREMQETEGLVLPDADAECGRGKAAPNVGTARPLIAVLLIADDDLCGVLRMRSQVEGEREPCSRTVFDGSRPISVLVKIHTMDYAKSQRS